MIIHNFLHETSTVATSPFRGHITLDGLYAMKLVLAVIIFHLHLRLCRAESLKSGNRIAHLEVRLVPLGLQIPNLVPGN